MSKYLTLRKVIAKKLKDKEFKKLYNEEGRKLKKRRQRDGT